MITGPIRGDHDVSVEISLLGDAVPWPFVLLKCGVRVDGRVAWQRRRYAVSARGIYRVQRSMMREAERFAFPRGK